MPTLFNCSLTTAVHKSYIYLSFSGCHMISTIKVHQPPPTPNPATRGATSCTLPLRRLDHLQYLDLTDCLSLEDSGLKMVVETCPQLLYLFLRRCTALTGKLTIVSSKHCWSNIFYYHLELELSRFESIRRP